MADGQTPPAMNATAWIGIVSSVLTILLTIFNTYTKAQIDTTDQQLRLRTQEFDAKLKERAASLEESKERTGRYTFVHNLFPDLMDNDATKKDLAINLIRLTLSEEEAAKFFAGLALSGNAELQVAGNAGIATINREKSGVQTAEGLEREGFQSLINGNYDNAIASFEAADKASPTYHQVYELARLLKSRRADLNDAPRRKQIFQQIATDYAWGAPPDLIEQIRGMGNR